MVNEIFSDSRRFTLVTIGVGPEHSIDAVCI